MVNRLNQWLENPGHEGKDLTPEQRTIKAVFLNGVAVGGSVLAFNAILSKLTNYKLSALGLQRSHSHNCRFARFSAVRISQLKKNKVDDKKVEEKKDDKKVEEKKDDKKVEEKRRQES